MLWIFLKERQVGDAPLWVQVALAVSIKLDMEMESHGSDSVMMGQSQHKTTGQSLWHVPLSARSELHSHPLGKMIDTVVEFSRKW